MAWQDQFVVGMQVRVSEDTGSSSFIFYGLSLRVTDWVCIGCMATGVIRHGRCVGLRWINSCDWSGLLPRAQEVAWMYVCGCVTEVCDNGMQ